jgi:UDP-N-acetylmuramyl pentapeptide phosphotransferase/UDP-N-acetylglucosamine-1-phosphate transferase
MDGINGITGLYSLVVLGGIQYVNYYVIKFIEPDMIWLPMLAAVVFLFFNFRKRAKCFAGDVGSVTIAFWIIFLLLKLIIISGNYLYILFLGVYGVDTVLTIIHRLGLKQNIFDAHRLHFYQILANEQKWPHLLVSTIYALMQLGIIVAVVFYLSILYRCFWLPYCPWLEHT